VLRHLASLAPHGTAPSRVDILVDNAGSELFSDLCLADALLLLLGPAVSVRLCVKVGACVAARVFLL
jgi:hypothetical protein